MTDDGSAPPAIDEATLERLRRGVPLTMDAMGRFALDGEPVTHPRVIEAFRRGLDITEAGEHQLHVGNQWCYLTIDDCPLRATAVLEGPRLRLDDGRALPLDPTTVWEEPGRGLRCAAPAIRSGRPLAVRFTNSAQMDLDRWLRWDEGEERASLIIDGRTYEIGDRPPGNAGRSELP
ncbi:MAG: hypothetical protein R3A51_21820 [Nannocystaceae bacterium]|nr:hypothetical protein [Myxococcales bacterium]